MPLGTVPFVIGAGPGRTGTASLSMALENLGYKTFHMKELMMGRADPVPWFELAEAARSDDADPERVRRLAARAARSMIEQGYTANTDFPSVFVYEALLEAVPDAKVVLSVRKSGRAWSESVSYTIGRMGPILHNKRPFKYLSYWSRFSADLNPWFFESMGVADVGTLAPEAVLDRDALARAHDDWIARVKATVPADRLLVHQSKDGYRPLCDHLGVPPDRCPPDYPYINDQFQMRVLLSGLVAINYAFWPAVLLALFLVIFLARRLFLRVHTKTKKFV